MSHFNGIPISARTHSVPEGGTCVEEISVGQKICRTCNSHPGRTGIQGGGRHRLHLLALYWLYTNEGRAQPSVLARIIRTLKTLSAGGASGAQRRWPRRPFITSLSIAKVHCLNIGTRIRSVSLFLMVYKDIYVYEVNFNISVLKPFI